MLRGRHLQSSGERRSGLVEVVGIDDQRLAELACGSGELAEHQHALFIALDQTPFIGSTTNANTNGIGNFGNSMPGREVVVGLQARF